MSKKPLEIDIVMGKPPDSVRVAKTWMENHGDLYVTNFAPDVTTGRLSYHASGIAHRYSELVKKRIGEGQPPRPKLRGLKGHMLVARLGCPLKLKPTGYEPKPDTKLRRTLTTAMAAIGFYYYVWAIESGRKDLVDRIRSTDPWPAVKIVGSVVADWSDPWILVTVAHWINDHPYDVKKYWPPIPGRVPYVTIPDEFEGTWLERPGPKMRPGDPYPEEWLREADEFMARERAREQRRAEKLGLWIPSFKKDS